MSNSSNRSKEYDTVHHITSRIAHKVRFLQEEAERNDLIEMIRRAAVFTGVKLLGWCIMINHFHILAFLPAPIEVDENEILRRYGVLKGAKGAATLEEQLSKLRLEGETGCKEAERLLDVQRKRRLSSSGSPKSTIVATAIQVRYGRVPITTAWSPTVIKT